MKYLVFQALLGGALVFSPAEFQPFRFASLLHEPAHEASAAIAPALRAHSHNDYAQERPLWDAIANRFYSVEADVYARHGELVVSHFGINLTGRLKDLYLDPLQERVRRLGSVYGDGRPFLLWIDVKSSAAEIPGMLQELFVSYPMLTRFSEKGTTPGPVTVVLTGNVQAKEKYARENRIRFACHDSTRFTLKDSDRDPAWCWYALNWSSYFNWDGSGTMPEAEARFLRALVAGAHAKGRKLRFWNNPETPEAWASMAEADVDLVSTDSLAQHAVRGLASISEKR